MSVANPGRFFLDLHCTMPATDQQAKAAFGVADFNRYRQQAVELDDDRRIEAALAAQPEPERGWTPKLRRPERDIGVRAAL
jgi:hypothetical protein